MQHPGLDSCIVTEKIVKLSCTVKSLYFTMAEPKRRYLVPGYRYLSRFIYPSNFRFVIVMTYQNHHHKMIKAGQPDSKVKERKLFSHFFLSARLLIILSSECSKS